MINRDDYMEFFTRKLYRTTINSKGETSSNAFVIPKLMLKLMSIPHGGAVTLSMAKDGSHMILEPARDSENKEAK